MQLAKSLSACPVYLATARRWDDEFEQRVQRHQAERKEGWESIEEEKFPSKLPLSGKVVLIDCVTLWLTNFFVDSAQDVDASLAAFKEEVDQLTKVHSDFIIISNEIGMGLHGDTATGRKFTDLQGWANQYLASVANKCTFMVAGLPLSLK